MSVILFVISAPCDRSLCFDKHRQCDDCTQLLHYLPFPLESLTTAAARSALSNPKTLNYNWKATFLWVEPPQRPSTDSHRHRLRNRNTRLTTGGVNHSGAATPGLFFPPHFGDSPVCLWRFFGITVCRKRTAPELALASADVRR